MSQGEFNKYTVRCDTIQHRGQGCWYRNMEQTTRLKKMIGDWVWPRLNPCILQDVTHDQLVFHLNTNHLCT